MSGLKRIHHGEHGGSHALRARSLRESRKEKAGSTSLPDESVTLACMLSVFSVVNTPKRSGASSK